MELFKPTPVGTYRGAISYTAYIHSAVGSYMVYGSVRHVEEWLSDLGRESGFFFGQVRFCHKFVATNLLISWNCIIRHNARIAKNLRHRDTFRRRSYGYTFVARYMNGEDVPLLKVRRLPRKWFDLAFPDSLQLMAASDLLIDNGMDYAANILRREATRTNQLRTGLFCGDTVTEPSKRKIAQKSV